MKATETAKRILSYPLTKGAKWFKSEDDLERRDISPGVMDRERELARRFLKDVISIYEGYPFSLFFDDLDDVLEEIHAMSSHPLSPVPRRDRKQSDDGD